MSFNPDTAWMDRNYETTSSSSDIAGREASFKRKPPQLSKMREAAKAMKDEPSLDQSRKTCRGLFCGLFSGGKRRTKKRRKKRRTKSRRKTKRRRKSRRRTKRRRRKR